ncbi:MAG: hypothetical protein DMG13_24820 [Acidobacteria bacterium]|nr:MAG: hypothetical protein DMG13_24820 [Acidobacteriota bacterium]
MKTNIRVNNTTHELSVDSRLTLLDALRDVPGLTGTKKGCDQGACGAYSRFVSPIIGVAWVVVVSRPLDPTPATRAGW